MADVLLKAENLTASYGQIEVLHGISFEVFDNEIAVILGANGAGKTTTIRALSGMVETTGTITFKREDISQLESDAIVRKGVAHVPQGRGTFPELTVEDNLRVHGGLAEPSGRAGGLQLPARGTGGRGLQGRQHRHERGVQRKRRMLLLY